MTAAVLAASGISAVLRPAFWAFFHEGAVFAGGDDDLEAGVVEVVCVGVALRAVAHNGDGPAFEQFEVGVFGVEDFHLGVSGKGWGGKGGLYMKEGGGGEFFGGGDRAVGRFAKRRLAGRIPKRRLGTTRFRGLGATGFRGLGRWGIRQAEIGRTHSQAEIGNDRTTETTEQGDAKHLPVLNFNPRPQTGATQPSRGRPQGCWRFNPRPQTGATQRSRLLGFRARGFNPRPQTGATQHSPAPPPTYTRFNPRPQTGATQHKRPRAAARAGFNPRPQTGATQHCVFRGFIVRGFNPRP